MAIFVFSTKKPMGIAAYMDEGMRNVVLVGGLPYREKRGKDNICRVNPVTYPKS